MFISKSDIYEKIKYNTYKNAITYKNNVSKIFFPVVLYNSYTKIAMLYSIICNSAAQLCAKCISIIWTPFCYMNGLYEVTRSPG
jgi:hypothetical protein